MIGVVACAHDAAASQAGVRGSDQARLLAPDWLPRLGGLVPQLVRRLQRLQRCTPIPTRRQMGMIKASWDIVVRRRAKRGGRRA